MAWPIAEGTGVQSQTAWQNRFVKTFKRDYVRCTRVPTRRPSSAKSTSDSKTTTRTIHPALKMLSPSRDHSSQFITRRVSGLVGQLHNTPTDSIEDLNASDTLVSWQLGRSLRDLLDIAEMLPAAVRTRRVTRAHRSQEWCSLPGLGSGSQEDGPQRREPNHNTRVRGGEIRTRLGAGGECPEDTR